MSLLRVRDVVPLEPYRVRLTLTDGSVIERDLSGLLVGGVLEAVCRDGALFGAVAVKGGTLVWPNGADLCPDVLIWGGFPPDESSGSVPASDAHPVSHGRNPVR